jgi:MFS family permease
MALFMAATTFGPVLGLGISGFISTVTWRWSFWIGVIVTGLAWSFLIFMLEIYAPIILKRRTQKLRKETGDASIMALIELEKPDIGHIVTVVLTRPTHMICFEPFVPCSCIYTSYTYGIFYIF